MTKVFLLTFLILLSGCHRPPQQEPIRSPATANQIKSKEIHYKSLSHNVIGYLAHPVNLKKSTPAIVVVHEWWGQTDYPRNRADMLAKMGYIAFAVDMYGNRKVTDHPQDAGEFSKAILSDASVASQRFDAAIRTLKSQPYVNPRKIGAIGFCFGGSVVLEMARQGKDLKGVVSFHGGLNTPTKATLNGTTSKILVLNGENDPFVKPEHITDFTQEMKIAKVDFEIINFQGAVHGFSNPAATAIGKKLKLPLAYSKKADEESWKKMTLFFTKIFRD